MIHTLCTRTAPSVSERGRETVPCKDWPLATASGGYGLDKELSPGPRLPPRDRRWGLFGRRQSVCVGAFQSNAPATITQPCDEAWLRHAKPGSGFPPSRLYG